MVSPVQTQTVFTVSGEPISWQQFLADIDAYQTKLAHLPPAQDVVLFHENCYAFAVRLFALANQGHRIILPPNGQPDTLNELAKITPFFSGATANTALQGVTYLDKLALGKVKPTTQLCWPTQGELVFFTSGSSGQAKQVVKPWRVINHELQQLQHTFTLKAHSRFIASVSHQHIYGLLFKLLWPLKAGYISELTQFSYPEHLAAQLKAQFPWVIISSPAQLSRLVQDNVLTNKAPHIHWLFSSGGPLLDEHAMCLYQQLAVAATQVYGSTETGGIAYRQVKKEVVPWQPFADITLSCDETGRLMLNSPLVAQPDYPLDDAGKVLKNGYFYLTGRLDRTIKMAEKRLNLDALEQRLSQHPWVNEGKVFLLNQAQPRLAAVVALSPAGFAYLQDASKHQLNQQLRNWLLGEFEAVCLPRKWRYVAQLPYNSLGKLPLHQLEKLFVNAD